MLRRTGVFLWRIFKGQRSEMASALFSLQAALDFQIDKLQLLYYLVTQGGQLSVRH
jgi:hypothetical protein